MPRVVLEATLDTPLGRLCLLNAHLEVFSERQRLAQVEALRALQRDAWALAHPGQPHAPTVGLHDPGGARLTFDYAFVSADLAPCVRGLQVCGMRVGELESGSDHQPLLLELG
jgi:endonuclease/exonuclease/phosphatase family metal-dependent hydrolase